MKTLASTFVSILFFPLLSFGQLNFSSNQITGPIPGSGGLYDVELCDIDKDADLDIIAIYKTPDKVVWFENQDGQGNFGPEQLISTTFDSPWTLQGADLDGDGDNDVVVADFENNTIEWYENLDGLGTFSSEIIITSDPYGPENIIAVDLDEDGDIDIVSGSRNDDTIAWYENLDGAGNFSGTNIIADDVDSPYGIIAAKMNTWKIDVISTSVNDNQIVVHRNSTSVASPYFVAQYVVTTDVDYIFHIDAGDLDGDGDPDIVSGSISDDKIAWYENLNSSNNYGNQQIIDITNNPSDIKIADIDNDGDNDVLYCSWNGGDFSWAENSDGLGNFIIQENIFPQLNNFASFAIGDIDNDGDLDIATGSYNSDQLWWHENKGTLNPCLNEYTLTMDQTGTQYYEAINKISIEATAISNAVLEFNAGNCIEFKPGFDLEAGASLNAYILGCQ